ncbi:MAG TPA: hypothetical protein VEX87_05205, partial [Skermanella sp.]|nr:hypothetical protein [Skermanella sp.]
MSLVQFLKGNTKIKSWYDGKKKKTVKFSLLYRKRKGFDNFNTVAYPTVDSPNKKLLMSGTR